MNADSVPEEGSRFEFLSANGYAKLTHPGKIRKKEQVLDLFSSKIIK